MTLDWAGLVNGPCVEIFGEPVTYQRGLDNRVFPVTGVFDDAYRPSNPLAIDGMEPMHVSTTAACLGVDLRAFEVDPEQGDLLTVRGVQFYVQDVHPDGKGGARLILNKQAGQR